MKRIVPVLFLGLLFVSSVAQPKRGLQPEDLFNYKEVADAQIAPDGACVAYTMTETSADRSRNVTHIWIVSTSGGEPKRLTKDEADDTTPLTQAEEMYTALKMRSVDTVLIRYPREGHGIREPKHRVDNLQRVLDWFEKYLQ